MKKIILYDKQTRKEVIFNNRDAVIRAIYSPLSLQYTFISPLLTGIIKRYEKKPLVLHTITDSEKRKLKQNPDYIQDIPKWEVPVYDKIVSASRFEQNLVDEFYTLYKSADEIIVKFINRNHDSLKATIREDN